MNDILLQRVAALETVLGSVNGKAVESLHNLKTVLDENTNMQSLQYALMECDVSVENIDYCDLEDGTSLEERKTIVLSHFDQYMKIVSTAEILVSEYSDIFSRFHDVLSRMPALNNKQLMLQRYEKVAIKFANIVKRIVVILEKYAILRFKQSKLMSSL